MGSTFLGKADLIGADKLAQPQRLNKFRAEIQKDHLMQVWKSHQLEGYKSNFLLTRLYQFPSASNHQSVFLLPISHVKVRDVASEFLTYVLFCLFDTRLSTWTLLKRELILY